MTRDPISLMLKVIKENTPNSNWVDTPLESFKILGGTNKGDVGEVFIERYLDAFDFSVERASSRVQEWDLKIFDKKFEIKTASEGKSGTFQFNHIRLDHKYDFLLCLGVCPTEIKYDFWSKGEVAEEKAGTRVRMAKNQSVTFKITKNLDQLSPIIELPKQLKERLS